MHYAHILTVNRLRLMVHLGFYEEERLTLQPVEISLRLYFPSAPECTRDDHAKFLDYGKLCAAITEWSLSQKFRLLEFMGQEGFNFVRQYVDANGYRDIKIWFSITKCEAPVPNLQGGTSFIHSDVPIGSTSFMPAL